VRVGGKGSRRRARFLRYRVNGPRNRPQNEHRHG
jgi:hypothetical protein